MKQKHGDCPIYYYAFAIVLTVSLLVSIMCFSQSKKTTYDSISPRFTVRSYNYVINDGVNEKKTAVYIDDKDSIARIEGDSLSVIKMLIKHIQWMDSVETQNRQELWKAINAGVDFTNTVPDYFKGKKVFWLLYMQRLKKLGFTTIKKK